MAYVPWTIKNFSGGLISMLGDTLIPDNASPDCQNVISRIVGTLLKRPGQARLTSTALGGAIRGLHAYYYGATPTRRIVAAANGVVSHWNGTEWTSLKTGLNTAADVLFEDCVNYMVSFNGVDAPWKWDGTTVSALANAPAKGRFCVLHKEKLFTVDADTPSTLVWSDSFAPETWTAKNYWDVKKGDGDEITNLTKFIGEQVIFKRRSIHSLRGTSLDDFRLDEMETRVGCVGKRAAVADGMRVYFVADDGFYEFNGMKATNLSKASVPKFWDTVNKQYIHKAAVKAWGGLIWVALPTGASTYNNAVLIYDPPNAITGKPGSFWPWTGINASCFIDYNSGTDVKLYAGDANAGYVNQQDTGTDDFGEATDAYWIGKTYDGGDAGYRKKTKKVLLEDSPDTTNVMTLSLSLDYGTFKHPPYYGKEGYMREFRLDIEENRWRYLQYKIAHKKTGACEIRGVTIPIKQYPGMKVRDIL